MTTLIAELIELARAEQQTAEREDIRLDLLVAEAVERAQAPSARPWCVRARPRRVDVVHGVPATIERAVRTCSTTPRSGARPARRSRSQVRDGRVLFATTVPASPTRIFRTSSTASTELAPLAACRAQGWDLAIVRQVAEAHGAEITAESAEGGGTRMVLDLGVAVGSAVLDTSYRLLTGLSGRAGSLLTMFFLAYMLAELRRRSGRTLTALGLALGVGLVVTVNALSTGLDRAQAEVLEPLTGVGTDMTVSRPIDFSPPARAVPTLSGEERQQLRSENGGGRFGLRNLGKPGRSSRGRLRLDCPALVPGERSRPDSRHRRRRRSSGRADAELDPHRGHRARGAGRAGVFSAPAEQGRARASGPTTSTRRV